MQRFSFSRWLKAPNRPARRRPVLDLTGLEGRDVPAAFTLGDLVVYRVGDGSAALTTAATPVFLDEYNSATANQAATVQSVAMPTTASGASHRLTAGGSTFGDGILTNSADGRYLVATGYDAAVGTTAVGGTPPATVNRVVALIGNNAVPDTTTGLTDATSNIRSAASTDGSAVWTVGATNPGPIRSAFVGTTGTSTPVSTTFSSLLGVGTFNSQLYVSGSVAGLDGLASVGSGLPTTSGNTTTPLPGFPTTGTAPFPTPRGFIFRDANTVYVADSRFSATIATNASGLQKWTFDGSFWNLQYVFNPGTNRGLVDVVADFSGATPVFYGVTSEASSATPDQLVKITEDPSGLSASQTAVLATAGTNEYFRGVAFAPRPLGAAADSVSLAGGAPVTVGSPATFTATVTGATAPTGWVTFSLGSSVLGVVPLTPTGATTAQAQLTTSSLPVGVDHVVATYGGDTAFVKNSGAFDQTVNGTNTTTVVTSSAATTPAANGTSVTFTATVSPTSGTAAPTGTVNFFEDGLPINAAPINVTPSGSNGTAQVTVVTGPIQSGTNLTPGIHTVTAVYTPATGSVFVASSANRVQPVNANPFGAGDVLVYRAGDGTSALSVNGNAVYVDEYTTAAGQTAPVQSILMPTSSVAGGNQALITCSQQSVEGQISLSGDGQYVYLTGYDQNLSTANFDLHASPAASVPRTIGRIRYDGTIDTSMALSDLADGGSVRGVFSPDNTHIYAAGTTTTTTGGVRFVAGYTPGITTSTLLDNGANPINEVMVSGGQLYASVGAPNSTAFKIGAVGTGLPTTAGQTITNLNNIPTGAASPVYPQGFFFAHLQVGPTTGPDTLYIADNGNFASGTITKWALVSGTWTLVDTITSGAGSDNPTMPSFDNVTGVVNGTNVTLYATYGNGGTTFAGPGFLVSLADTGGFNAPVPTHAATTLASVSTTSKETFRGAVPVPTQPVTPPTVAGVQVNDGGAQRSEVQSIKVTFSQPVNFAGGNANAAAAFTLSRVGGGGNVGLAANVTTTATQTTVTLTFTNANAAVVDTLPSANGGANSLADGVYHLAIADGAVTGTNGLGLDGDNNGTAGGAYSSPADTAGSGAGHQLGLYRLFGDVDGNGTDDAFDVGPLRLAFNSFGPNPPYLAYLDANNDGTIDAVDVGQFRVRFNANLFP
jgi:Bacterial Ig-like domain (group 3)